MFKINTTLLNLVRTLGLLLSLAMVSFFYVATAQAAQVSLAWDSSPSSNVAGYRIYYGQAPGNYSANTPVDIVGKQTTSTVITGLQDGVPYYFAAKAYDTSTPPNESGFSNEVCQPCASSTAPTANFSATPTIGFVPLQVNFTDTSTASTGNTITTWYWTFGDGTTSNMPAPAHTYSTPGTYPVSLTVRDTANRSNTLTKPNYIVANAASPVAPVADFSASSPRTGMAPLTVTFINNSTDTVTGTIWSWNFGDGSPISPDQNPTHIYASSGTYTVSLTATDSAGSNTKTRIGYITVSSSDSLSPTCPCSIWDAGVTPTVVAELDTSAVEIGVKFKSDVNGFITGIRFYKASTNTGTHVGNLWTSRGTLRASATFTGETDSGWQQVNFATPVAITANSVYVASYHTNVGHYADDKGYFTATGIDNPPLHALQDGARGPNGVYLYGPGGFPTNTYWSSNYWVDVVFTPQ